MNPEQMKELVGLLQTLGEEQFTTLVQQVKAVREKGAALPTIQAGGGATGSIPMDAANSAAVRVAYQGRLGGPGQGANFPMPFPGVPQSVPMQSNTQGKLADILSGDPELAAIYSEIVQNNPALAQMVSERLGQGGSPAMDQTMALGGASAVAGLESRGVAPYPLGDAVMGPMQGGLPPATPAAPMTRPMRGAIPPRGEL